MSKQLSYQQKREYLPDLILRDGGYWCYQCRVPFKNNNHIFEHLNDNREDSRFENIALACDFCNNKKPYDLEMQIKAKQKLRQNEESNFVREKKCAIDNNKEFSEEIEINVTNSEITEQYITESVNTNGFIEYSDALNSPVYLCKTKTGHGSQQSIRNYISFLTSIVGPFQIVRDENKRKLIVRRTQN